MPQSDQKKKKKRREEHQVLSVHSQPSFCLGAGLLTPPRTQQPAAFPTMNKAAPCLSKDPPTAANKRVRMGERQGEELEECTPSRRERHRKVGGGGGGWGAAGGSQDSLDPGVKPIGAYTS